MRFLRLAIGSSAFAPYEKKGRKQKAPDSWKNSGRHIRAMFSRKTSVGTELRASQSRPLSLFGDFNIERRWVNLVGIHNGFSVSSGLLERPLCLLVRRVVYEEDNEIRALDVSLFDAEVVGVKQLPSRQGLGDLGVEGCMPADKHPFRLLKRFSASVSDISFGGGVMDVFAGGRLAVSALTLSDRSWRVDPNFASRSSLNASLLRRAVISAFAEVSSSSSPFVDSLEFPC